MSATKTTESKHQVISSWIHQINWHPGQAMNPKLVHRRQNETGKQDPESNGAKAKDESWPVSSPQLSGRRRRKLPPAGKAAVPGRRRRHAGTGTEGPGGDGHGHFRHLLPPWRKKLPRSVRGWRSNLVQETGGEVVLQRRRRWWDHDDDIYGCRGGSIHRIEGGGNGRWARALPLNLAASPHPPSLRIYASRARTHTLSSRFSPSDWCLFRRGTIWSFCNWENGVHDKCR